LELPVIHFIGKGEGEMTYLLLIIGFVLLIKGADFFVEGSSSVAKILKVPSIIIGLTVVAFGTSMPEASVSIISALKGANDLAVGNVLGSNIFNLLVVLGCSALMQPLHAGGQVVRKELPFSIFITALLVGFSVGPNFSDILSGNENYMIGRTEGILLLLLFFYFVGSQVKEALKARKEKIAVEEEEEIELEEEVEEYKVLSPLKSVVYIIVGIIAIVCGGDFVVDSASEIAMQFGFSQTFIGLTIVAMGTSLPELVTSVVASKKGENDLALGNAVGSNIFNILLILGASAAISPVSVTAVAISDMIILIAMSIFAYWCAKTKETLSKGEGVMFLLIYAIYFVYIYMR